jgi:glucokinase-like ROK family protein
VPKAELPTRPAYDRETPSEGRFRPPAAEHGAIRGGVLADESLIEVLASIRDGAQSRPDVHARTGLGRGVVAQRVRDLLDRGLVTDLEVGTSTGGRPPRQLRFNADVGRLLVAFVGATSLDVAITDVAGAIIEQRAEESDVASGPSPILERIEELFDELLARHGTARLWGIGIGIPGPVEFDTGRPVAPPIMPGWDRYPIRARLTARYRVETWVDNDANVMALGEWRHGVAQGHRNVIFVKIGSGIGAGLISDGLLHRGAQGSAGDVGHVQVSDDTSILCRCGNRGCLEAIVGGTALAREGERAARDGRSPWLADVLRRTGTITARDLSAGGSFGDQTSIELLQSCGTLVGKMLASMVNFFNPSLIVLGGGVAKAGDLLLASTRQAIYGRSLPLATRTLEVQTSELGDQAGLLGAATMVLDELLSRELLPRWLEAGHPSMIASGATR